MATWEHARASVSDAPVEEYLEVAHALADVAAGITRRYFRSSVSVDTKFDESPVTIADREAEAAMREVIRARFPHHAIFGEEQGFSAGEHDSSLDLMWVIDPIDGTKSFITGKPLFGTLISLVCDGRPILGIIDQPILGERWVGVEGQRSTLNGNIIATRQCPTISSAYLYATTPHMFEGESAEAFDRVRKACKIPMYGCDCYAYGLLAAGHCDLVVEADLKPYDYMALVPIIQGAGGIVTDWKGNRLGWTSMEAADGKAPPGEIVAAGDEMCHRQVIELLKWR
jgi:inositol-phosphate phosphatase/L-galactose 1-phosphate phosphatase/histidinol-phosphatase